MLDLSFPDLHDIGAATRGPAATCARRRGKLGDGVVPGVRRTAGPARTDSGEIQGNSAGAGRAARSHGAIERALNVSMDVTANW
jgi:hypothetical protein